MIPPSKKSVPADYSNTVEATPVKGIELILTHMCNVLVTVKKMLSVKK